MSARLLRLAIPAVVFFVIVVGVNLLLGNGIVPGLVIGLVAVAAFMGAELVFGRTGKPDSNDSNGNDSNDGANGAA
ncbi:hypothetical protein [Kineosporia succinea]|uniref:ABC-type transport system involved in cytochrome bd biosynthesis fused ATPase/permease subunit n=1 Tax=Kineosporia succinea TaxID=84632 RepID=A0ABT9NWD9_9ACTN|nr:hypothetical protein [Kineosporia succinea]MDP9824325.1 ABC-type transport system involved in cytochrome bd biosynthesis fused ATPase/permease subunit [Kineosporia succinea]